MTVKTMARNREYAKDTPDTDAFIDNAIYNEGPWSYCDNEVISSVVSGGSAITRWIPSRGVNWLREHVQHLVYVKPDDYDPESETYGDFLAGLDPLEPCDYGPTPNWGACEYAVEMGTVSFQSKTLTENDLNIRECKNSPIYTNANQTGLPARALATDAEWAVAQAGQLLENHLDWNVWNGDPAAYELTYDGLDKIISVGYVDNHRVGDGDCKFVDPLVYSGIGLGSDLGALISFTRAVIRKILKRAKDRNRPLGQQDIALFMPSSHWNVIADALACQGLAGSCGTDVVINSSGGDFRREREFYTSSASPYGEGFFPIGGFNIGVITDDLLGYNTLVGTDPAVTGDWYVLTRRFAGMNILEQQYLDYSEVFNVSTGVKPNYRDEIILQNGMIKQGWKELNNKCWQAYVEMRGRIVSRYQPLQAKIQDITLETFLEDENESVNFASLDWYAA